MPSALREDHLKRMEKVLLDLLINTESDHCLLCDSGGYVLLEEGSDRRDPFLISALGAGVFAASRELARIMGEDEFSAVFHQGEKKSIFIRAVSSEVLLVVIFSRSGSLGLVKLYATPAAMSVRRVLDDVKAAGETGEAADHRQFVINDESGLFAAEPQAPKA